jgi:hypothetical protein
VDGWNGDAGEFVVGTVVVDGPQIALAVNEFDDEYGATGARVIAVSAR